MTTERLMAELDGAECVVYDANGYLLVWYGGESTGIHIYDASGTEVDYYQMGARESGSYTAREVRESMNAHILGDEDEA
jgi:hypothetical protein